MAIAKRKESADTYRQKLSNYLSEVTHLILALENARNAYREEDRRDELAVMLNDIMLLQAELNQSSYGQNPALSYAPAQPSVQPAIQSSSGQIGAQSYTQPQPSAARPSYVAPQSTASRSTAPLTRFYEQQQGDDGEGGGNVF